MDANELRLWLMHDERRALLNMGELEKQAGVPPTTLQKAVRTDKSQRSIPGKHVPAILSTLRKLDLPENN